MIQALVRDLWLALPKASGAPVAWNNESAFLLAVSGNSPPSSSISELELPLQWCGQCRVVLRRCRV